MKKPIGILFFSLTMVLILLIVGIFSLLFFVNPNQFKAPLSEEISQLTGRKVTIQGDLHWAFFPSLGFHVQQVIMSDAPSFGKTPFAVIGEGNIQIKLLPLFKKHVEVSMASLKDVVLNLERLPGGQTNWNDLVAHLNKDNTASPSTSQSSQPSPAKKHFSFHVPEINIQNVSIHWDDEMLKRNTLFTINTFHVKDFNLKGNAFPVLLQMDIKNKAPGLQAHVEMKGTFLLDPEKDTYAIQPLQGMGTLQHLLPWNQGPISFHINSKVALHFNEKEGSLNSLSLILDNSTLTGDLQWHFSPEKSFLLPVTLKGQVHVNTLPIDHLKMHNVSALLEKTPQQWTLGPIKGEFYGGDYQGTVSLNTSQGTPSIQATQSLDHVNLKSLLTDLNLPRFIDGTTQFSSSLHTEGKDFQSLMQHLNGSASYALTQGSVEGIDLQKALQAASSLLTQAQIPSGSVKGSTSFTSLTGHFNINEGIAKNPDLLLTSPLFSAGGTGMLNLNQQTLHYQINVRTSGASIPPIKKLESMLGGGIPIEVKGSFSNPQVSPDWSTIRNAVAKQMLQEGIHNTIKNVRSLFGH